MARQKLKDIKKEIKEENELNYGEETISGSQPSTDSDDDVQVVVEKTFGKKITSNKNKKDPIVLEE